MVNNDLVECFFARESIRSVGLGGTSAHFVQYHLKTRLKQKFRPKYA